MRIFASLRETTIGRALIAWWVDLPFWLAVDTLLILTLAPAWWVWSTGQAALAILLTFPAALVCAGIARAFAATLDDRPPRWRALLGVHLPSMLTLWAALAVLALSFLLSLPPALFALQCIIAVVVLLVAPFVHCLPALMDAPIQTHGRNALVIAVHYPLVALGLVALLVLLGAVCAAVHPLLFVLVPALWIGIAVYSTDEIVQTLLHQRG